MVKNVSPLPPRGINVFRIRGLMQAEWASYHSALYLAQVIFNDARDKDADAQHPKKKFVHCCWRLPLLHTWKK